jgi:surfactin synthase thioesterase subunit
MRESYEAGVVWPAPRPAAGRLLVCLGYCGGGTAPFRPWRDALDESVDLAVVCYPGRERRISEPAARDFDELVHDSVAAVRSVVHRPYVLFGHSMGAWVAFEVAVWLERSEVPPLALIVSASIAPNRAAGYLTRTPHSSADDRELLDWMARSGQLPAVVLADPDMRQYAADLFRADKRAIESYRFTPGSVVHAPMQVLRGVDDAECDAVEADDDAWRALAGGGFVSDRLPGGHFYTDEVWAGLPRRMRALSTAWRCL